MATKELIATVTLTSTTTSIDFSSVPQTYTDLVCVFALKTNFSGSDYDDASVKFNNSTANGSYRHLRAYGASMGSGSFWSVPGFIYVGGNSSTANNFGVGTMCVYNYAGATSKAVGIESVMDNRNSNTFIATSAGVWANSAAVNQVTFYSLNGASFVAGSTASLYGLKKGSDGTTTVS